MSIIINKLFRLSRMSKTVKIHYNKFNKYFEKIINDGTKFLLFNFLAFCRYQMNNIF